MSWWYGWRLGLLLLLGACGPPALVGTDLNAIPTPDFTLNDSRGQPVQLSALRGQVVVLTFLYTSCPDTCPLITGKLRQIQTELGSEAERVSLVVVSVDPQRDTAEQV
jgi:protein SCO1/2